MCEKNWTINRYLKSGGNLVGLRKLVVDARISRGTRAETSEHEFGGDLGDGGGVSGVNGGSRCRRLAAAVVPCGHLAGQILL